jgi:hypothetical protein
MFLECNRYDNEMAGSDELNELVRSMSNYWRTMLLKHDDATLGIGWVDVP